MLDFPYRLPLLRSTLIPRFAALAVVASSHQGSQINWRLESRKSFALNKMITRNNEIDRRRKLNMHFDDLLPASLRPAPADGGGSEGMSNVPAGKGGDEPMFDCSEDGKENYPAPLLQPSREPSPGILGGIPTPSSSSPMTAPLNSRPPSQDMHVKPLSSESLHNSANGAVGGVAGQINAFARINELNKMSKPTIQHEVRTCLPLPRSPPSPPSSSPRHRVWPAAGCAQGKEGEPVGACQMAPCAVPGVEGRKEEDE
eukprot:768748-Hanusia_phi.AAC.1